MFVSRKRTAFLLLLVCLSSLWVVFQNVTLNRSLFKWSDTRRQLIEASRVRPANPRKPISNSSVKTSRLKFAFQPPPPLENEERSEGYTAEDMYFRRWQVAHNVDPVRPVRGPQAGNERRWRGWSDHHKGMKEAEMYEALKQRQEERRRQVEQMERQRYINRVKGADEESEKDDDNDNDNAVADDLSSSYVIQREWLKSRLDGYCNANHIPEGHEGRVPDRHKLQSVHVLTRHGDRTPQENARTGQLAPFKWECSLVEANKKIGSIHLDKFIRVVRAGMRDTSNMDGGTRSTLLEIPMKEWSVRCYASQLTPQGWVQHMRLGDYMKKRYWHALGLSTANSKRGISVRSTTSPRTTQSAIAFLFGFLPNFTLQDIALIKNVQSTTFCTEQHCVCAAVAKLADDVGKQYTSHHKKKNITSLAKQASRLMYIKDPLYSIPNPSRLVELLTARACHKSNLPCTDNGCVDEAMFENVFKTVDAISIAIRSGTNNSAEMYGRLAMHPLLTSISSTMRYLERMHSSLPRFYLYSGHDITLTPMLDALGLVYPWPGYASRIVFEQWYHQSLRQYALRILYNGVDVTSRVRFCKDKLLESGLCPFSAFYGFLDHENLNIFNTETFEGACTWGMED